jgi:hypothetical protein
MPNAFDTQFDTLQVLSFPISFQLSDDGALQIWSICSLSPFTEICLLDPAECRLFDKLVVNSLFFNNLDGTGSSLSTTVF